MSLDVAKFIDGLHEYLARALKPLADRIKALEEERKNSAAAEMIEHKLSRHGEHLARLETRLAHAERRLKQYETEQVR